MDDEHYEGQFHFVPVVPGRTFGGLSFCVFFDLIIYTYLLYFSFNAVGVRRKDSCVTSLRSGLVQDGHVLDFVQAMPGVPSSFLFLVL